MSHDYYTIFKDFQSLVVGAMGFIGIIVTLLLNGYKDRSLYKWKEDRDRQSLLSGLRAELELVTNALKMNVARCTDVEPGGSILVQKNLIKPILFLSCSDNVTLIPSDSIGSTIRAYALIEEYPIRLLFAMGDC